MIKTQSINIAVSMPIWLAEIFRAELNPFNYEHGSVVYPPPHAPHPECLPRKMNAESNWRAIISVPMSVISDFNKMLVSFTKRHQGSLEDLGEEHTSRPGVVHVASSCPRDADPVCGISEVFDRR